MAATRFQGYFSVNKSDDNSSRHRTAPKGGTFLGVLKSLHPWWLIVAHFFFCIFLALIMLFALNGYMALDGTSSPRYSNGKYKLQSGEIITLISAALVVLDFVSSGWAGVVFTKFAYATYLEYKDKGEDEELMKKRFDLIMDTHMPMLARFPGKEDSPKGFLSRYNWKLWAIALLVFIAIRPQAVIGPIFEGALDWTSSIELGDSTKQVASGNPDANFPSWRWYQSGTTSRGDVRQAAGMGSLAWENSSTSDTTSRRCRHVINNTKFPLGSILYNATIPCITIDSVSWPTSYTPEKQRAVELVINNSSLLSVSGDPNIWGATPAGAVLFDPKNDTLKIPASLGFRSNSTLLPVSISTPVYPESFMFSGSMTAVVMLTKKFSFAPEVDKFGFPNPNNVFPFGSILIGSAYQPDRLYTFLDVNFTVGVMTPKTSTFVTSRVVEGGDGNPQDADIQPGPWVKEALYLLPDVMMAVAEMNTTSLNTWNDLLGYTEKLIRYSYLGAWDMLQRSYDPNSTQIAATLAEPRLQASVSRARVLAWLGIQLLFTLTGLVVIYLHMMKYEPVVGGAGDIEKIQKVNGVANFVDAIARAKRTQRLCSCGNDTEGNP